MNLKHNFFHSLGGWLAQITTFSAAFLKPNDVSFERWNDLEPFHAQTTVFDSPGCLPMLKKLKEKFETEENKIALNSLSITSYLSAPNQVNTCNEHFGKVYRIFFDTSKMNYMDRNLGYTLMTHSIENIVKFFCPQKELNIQEVLEWPTREGLTGVQELEKFLKYADHRNCYHIRSKMRNAMKNINIRYNTKHFDKTSLPLNIFTKREQHFLEHFQWIRQLPNLNLTLLFGDANSSSEIIDGLASFDIQNQNLQVSNPEIAKKFIPHLKLLLKLFPDLAEESRRLLTDHNVRRNILDFETEKCLKKVNDDPLEFKPSSIDFEKFIEKKISYVKIKSGKAWNGLLMVYKSFDQSKFKENYEASSVMVLDVQRASVINELINFENHLAASKSKSLLILYCEENKNLNSELLRILLEELNQHQHVNVILIGDSESDLLSQQMKETNQEYYNEVEKVLSWNELTEESQEKILNRDINFQGGRESLKELLESSLSHDFDEKVFTQLLSEKNLNVNIDPLASCDVSVYTTVNDGKFIKPKYIFESLEMNDDVFVISGLYDVNLRNASEEIAAILKPCDEKQRDLINDNLFDKSGKLQWISTIGSAKCLSEFDEKCRNLKTGNSEKTIHLLKVKEGRLSWRKSYCLHSFVERNLKMNSKSFDNNEKFIAILGQDGEGKSTLLSQLSRKAMEEAWTIHINFKGLSLDSLDLEKIDHESLTAFINNTVPYDPENELQSFVLRHKLGPQSHKPVHFFFDGFEQIQTLKDRKKAIGLLKFIKNETQCFITLTADESLADELEFSTCTLEKMNRSDREKLLKDYWRSRFSLVYGAKKCAEIFDDDKKSKFKAFSNILLEQLDSTIDEKGGALMGVPRQLRLLAEGFQDDFDKYIQMNNMKQKILDGLKLKTFYKQYINSKYDLYVTAKAKVASFDKKSKSLMKSFQNVSVDSLVPQEAKDLVNKSDIFSADYVILKLTKGQSPPKVLAILTGYLLTDSRCENIRTYLNKHKEYLPTTAAFEINDKNASDLLGLPMITSCKEGHDEVLKFIIEILKNKPDLKNVVLGEDVFQKNALNYAFENSNEHCVKVLMEFLIEYGDRKAFEENLKNNKDAMNNFFGTESEWMAEFLINNELEI